MSGIVNPSSFDYQTIQTLTDFSLAYMQDATGFAAEKVFPTIKRSTVSGRYVRHDRAALNRDEMRKRALASESSATTFGHNYDTYLTERWALKTPFDFAVMDAADEYWDIEKNMTDFLMMKLLINKENSFVSRFIPNNNPVPGAVWRFVADGNAVATTPGSYDPADVTDVNNKVQFWNLPASTPLQDIRGAMLRMKQITGFKPNKLVLSLAVAHVLLDHEDILDRIAGGATNASPATVNWTLLAGLLGLDEVIVMDAIQNLSDQGLVENSQFVAGKHALLVYAPSKVSPYTATAGATFVWTGDHRDTGKNGFFLNRFIEPQKNMFEIEIETNYDMKLVDPALGFMFNNIVQ